MSSSDAERVVTLLDYGAGNVRSIRNAITRLGWSIVDVTTPDDISNAKRLIFPGVGSFKSAMDNLHSKGVSDHTTTHCTQHTHTRALSPAHLHAPVPHPPSLSPSLSLSCCGQFVAPLQRYIRSGRPFMGICIGMQALFEWSAEGDAEGLGIIPGRVERFTCQLAVPHIGWNSLALHLAHSSPSTSTAPAPPSLFTGLPSEKFYFVHSFRALPTPGNLAFVRTFTDYGERFISTLQHGHLLATQFHPEKSGEAGLRLFQTFLDSSLEATEESVQKAAELLRTDQLVDEGEGGAVSGAAAAVLDVEERKEGGWTELSKRIIACLDVRENDQGDLVVTKGDQYDVRERVADSSGGSGKGAVRNLGKPVELARAYYEQGADEITFLNITQFRAEPLADLPLLDVLRQTSESVFVPLCVGGGIRDYVDAQGKAWSSLRVAAEYFRSGADKVSIGSDAVLAAEEWWRSGRKASGCSSIEQISQVYGAQAVVVSIDPRRVYVASPSDTPHATILTSPSPSSPSCSYCWYQCTIRGGREGRDLDVVQLVQAVEALGAGELLLNCMDMDGQMQGYDVELIAWVLRETRLPVIASSGAGRVQHFSAVFRDTAVQAALAAGIFHRKEVPISAVKAHLHEEHIPVRR